ncbi:MAG: hypothetical protein NVSMB52_10940 [Chloroflexota bacterium]
MWWDGSDPATLRPIVDLFLDLWIAPDGGYVVLDEDEFEKAVADSVLTDGQASSALQTSQSLVEAVVGGQFPPDSVRVFQT